MTARLSKAACRDGAVQVATVNPPCMCPHCGYNFEADRHIEMGPWTLWPRYVLWNNGDVGLTPAESGILYTLAKADGDWVSADAILNRISDSENRNVIAVLVNRIRKKLGDLTPIESDPNRKGGRGYRWRRQLLRAS